MAEEVDNILDEDDSLTAERNAWDRNSVFLLIKEYKKYRREFNNPDVRKRLYWEKVCNNLAALGYYFDVEQCEKKWRNLKKTFKDNECKPVVTWVYYDALQDVFSSERNFMKQKRMLENGRNVNSVLEMKMDSHEENSLESNAEDSNDSTPPSWFVDFLDQYREDEKKKMKMLEDMHSDVIKIEKEKCSLLKTLIEKLS